MKEIERVPLRPFTRFCMSIGAVPSSYLAGLTIEEQLLWFCSYLEKQVIPAVNNNGEAVEELQNLFTELQTYVTNYFDNLDVQEEINNKLDEMAESGELAEAVSQILDLNPIITFDNVEDMKESENLNEGVIIQTLNYGDNDKNGSIYKIVTDTNNQLIADDINIINVGNNKKAIKYSNFYNATEPLPTNYMENDYAFIMTFNSEKFQLENYIMHEPAQFLKLKDNSVPYGTSYADPTLLYKDGVFYLVYDRTYTPDLPADVPASPFHGSNRLFMRTSTNLREWSAEVKIEAPSNMWLMNAPEFFQDENDVYLLFTGLTDYTLDQTQTAYTYKSYIMRATSNDLSSWTTPQEITLGDSRESTIDPCLIYNPSNATYYLFVKDEVATKLVQYSSSTLNNFTYVQDIIEDREGAEIITMNDKYYLYFEDYGAKVLYVSESTNLLTWSNPKRVNLFYKNNDSKHFGFINVNSEETHLFFDNYIQTFPNFETNAKAYWTAKSDYKINDRINLIGYDIDPLVLQKNTIYYCNSGTYTIDNFDINNLDYGDLVGFFVGSDQNGTYIKIKTGSKLYANVNQGSYVGIGNIYGNNNTLVMFMKAFNFLIPITENNYQYLNNRVTKSHIFTGTIKQGINNPTAGSPFTIGIPVDIKDINLYSHNTYQLVIDSGDGYIASLNQAYVDIGHVSAGYTANVSSPVNLKGSTISALSVAMSADFNTLNVTFTPTSAARCNVSLHLLATPL